MKALVWPVATYGCESWTLRKNEETRLWDERTEKDSAGFVDSKENKWLGSWQSWSKEGTVTHRQSKEAGTRRSHHEETRQLPGEIDNARNNARCTQARKDTHGLDGQHQDVDGTARGRVSQNDRGQTTEINGDSTCMVWPTLGSRTAKEQNRTTCDKTCYIIMQNRLNMESKHFSGRDICGDTRWAKVITAIIARSACSVFSSVRGFLKFFSPRRGDRLHRCGDLAWRTPTKLRNYASDPKRFRGARRAYSRSSRSPWWGSNIARRRETKLTSKCAGGVQCPISDTADVSSLRLGRDKARLWHCSSKSVLNLLLRLSKWRYPHLLLNTGLCSMHI